MLSRRWARTIIIGAVIVLAGLSGLSPGARAAPPAQQLLSFDSEAPVTGTLDNASPQVSYMFQCFENMVGSVYVETTSGDLAVTIDARDPFGQSFASGRMEQKNPNVSVAEAFVMPTTGICSVVLSRTGSTTGTYAARLLPGYALLDTWDTFDGAGRPLRLTWSPYTSESMDVAVEAQRLRILLMTDNLVGYAVPDDDLSWSDLYIQADFVIDGLPSYHEYGFLFRLDDAAEDFYLVTVSNGNVWSVYYYRDEWNAIQDWTDSTVVDGSAKQARLGLLVQDNRITLYFNNQLVGEATDSTRFASEGSIALAAATTADQTDWLTVYVDNLIVTHPYRSGPATLPFGDQGASPTPTRAFPLIGSTKTPAPALPSPTPAPALPSPTPTRTPTRVPPSPTPFPTAIPILPSPTSSGLTLLNWASSRPSDIVSELQRNGLVPSGGSIGMTVPSSFGDTSSAGFNFYPLGGGSTFRNFVLSFDATMEQSAVQSGCGMRFRSSGSGVTSAMVTPEGAAFLIQWDSAGNTHPSSYYDYPLAVVSGVGSTNRVIVAAIEDTMAMWVNGQLATVGTFTAGSGSLALEVFVAQDDFGATQRTYCQLNNIWLWSF